MARSRPGTVSYTHLTRCTGSWRHIRVIERRRCPRGRRMTVITGSGRQPAFMPRWNTRRDRPVVAGGTARRCHGRVVHRRRPPAGRPVTAVAGNSPVGSTLVIRWDAGRIDSMTARTSPWRHIRMIKRRRSPRGRFMTGVTGPRRRAAFVARWRCV